MSWQDDSVGKVIVEQGLQTEFIPENILKRNEGIVIWPLRTCYIMFAHTCVFTFITNKVLKEMISIASLV